MMLKTLVNDAHYPEGPLWVDDRLLWVEFGRDAVMRLEADGEPRVLWSSPGVGPAAVTAGAEDDLWVTGYGNNSLIRIGRDGSFLEAVDRDAQGRVLLGPNDLVLDGQGRLIFTLSGVFELDAPVQGRVCLRTAAGEIRTVADGIHYANGVALSKCGEQLVVSEHFKNRVLSFDVQPDGTLSGRRVLAELDSIAPRLEVAPERKEGAQRRRGGAPSHARRAMAAQVPVTDPRLGPDGLKVTASGVVLVAQYGGGRVIAINPDGTLHKVFTLPLRFVTNVGFGATEETVYITAFESEEPPCRGAVLEAQIKRLNNR
jgi:sugar lactone lactonase YvrE